MACPVFVPGRYVALRLHIHCIGRPDELYTPPIETLVTMIGAYATLNVRHVRPPGAQDGSPLALAREADALRRSWPNRAYAVALSAEGKRHDTETFARWLDRRRQEDRPVLFLVGGAYGLDAGLKSACREVMSLSSLTLSHRVALLVLVEQVYRGLTILNGHPYNK